jgi:hypothetical protein
VLVVVTLDIILKPPELAKFEVIEKDLFSGPFV